MNNSVCPARIGMPFKIHGCSYYTHQRISGSDSQDSIQDRGHLRKLPEELIALRQALKDVYISRIEFHGAFQILDMLFPTPLASIHITGQGEDVRVIGQRAPRDGKFSPGAVVVEIAVIVNPNRGKMCFPSIRS